MKAIAFYGENGCPPLCPWLEFGPKGNCAFADIEWASPTLSRPLPGESCPVPNIPEPKQGCFDLQSLGDFVVKLRRKA